MVLLSDHISVSIDVVKHMAIIHKPSARRATFQEPRVKPVKRESMTSKQEAKFATGTKGYVGSMPVSKRCA